MSAADRRLESGRRTSRTLRQLGGYGVSAVAGLGEPTRSQLSGLLSTGAAAAACQCQTDEAAERTEEGQVGVSIGSPALLTREQQRRDRSGAVGTVAAHEQVGAAQGFLALLEGKLDGTPLPRFRVYD